MWPVYFGVGWVLVVVFVVAVMSTTSDRVVLTPEQASDLEELVQAQDSRIRYLSKELGGGSRVILPSSVHAHELRQAAGERFIREVWSPC